MSPFLCRWVYFRLETLHKFSITSAWISVFLIAFIMGFAGCINVIYRLSRTATARTTPPIPSRKTKSWVVLHWSRLPQCLHLPLNIATILYSNVYKFVYAFVLLFYIYLDLHFQKINFVFDSACHRCHDYNGHLRRR